MNSVMETHHPAEWWSDHQLAEHKLPSKGVGWFHPGTHRPGSASCPERATPPADDQEATEDYRVHDFSGQTGPGVQRGGRNV